MRKSNVIKQLQHPKINKILLSFSVPKTPKQVEKELGIKKLSLRPFVEKNLLKSLNPSANKGRFYVLTNNTKKLLELSDHKKQYTTNWCLIGWILASPRQRHTILKVMDSVKRTSENIRERASKYNPHLTRISTKEILKELVSKGMIETIMPGRERFYWISDKEKKVLNNTEYCLVHNLI